MRIDHAKLRRTVLCAGTCFVVLGVVQVARAADTRFDAFMGRVVGNQTTVGFGTGGTPLVTSSAGLGTPATVGNMGLSQAGSGVTVGGNVKVPLGNTGKAAGTVAAAAVSRGAFLRGLATVLSGPAGMLSIAATAPMVYQWLKSGGILFTDDGVVRGAPGGLPSCTVGFTTGSGGIGCTREEACANLKMPGYVWAGRLHQGGSGTYYCAMAGGTDGDIGGGVPGRYDMIAGPGPLPLNPDPNYPPSMADIAPYMDRPEAPALTPNVVAEAVTKLGVDPFGAQPAPVQVTGPSTVPGEKVQTSTQTRVIPGTTTEVGQGYSGETQPATRTRTSTQSHNVTYNDNRVSYTTTNNTTTNITNNVTGGSSTTTETEQREEDGETECEKNPQSLNCADLDTPDDEIPKTTASVAYQDENPFGGGACPASKYTNVGGQSVKVWDWEQTCGYITGPVYWITVTLGAFAATMIVAGGTGARL